jgi:hypothetical protein
MQRWRSHGAIESREVSITWEAFLVSMRLEHDASPNVLRQRCQVRPGLAICVVLAPLVIAASSSTGAVAGRTGQPAAGKSATSQAAIVGTWRRVTMAYPGENWQRAR